MPDFYQIPQGGQAHRGPPVPPNQPYAQGGRQPSASPGFQQRPVDPRLSYQVPQQQPLRPGPQQFGRPPQRPYSDITSPQSQRPYRQPPQGQNEAPRLHDDIVPDEFGRFIEVSDLTAATFTEEKYCQYLSTPIAIRFEKVEPQNKYDSAGEKVKSTWLNCTRTLLPNFDTVRADEEIQRLNRKDNKKGLTLLKKNQSLGSNAQKQVKKAELDLQNYVQDPRFHIVLKQLDWTERSVVEQHGKGSKRRSSKKPRKERASITAYFSRCPKSDQVPSALYRQLEMEKLQGQKETEQQHWERELAARTGREDQAREKREHEEKMAEHKVRQQEAIANQIHQQRMMSQQNQQRPTGQQIPAGQPMYSTHQVPHPQGRPHLPQYQPEPAAYGQPQGRPPTAPQQSGPLPAQQPHSQAYNGFQQGRPQQPPNGQGMPPQAFWQTAPQQGQQQGPPPRFKQTPSDTRPGASVGGPNIQPIRQPTQGERPIITVVTEHDNHPKHKRSASLHASSSSGYSGCSDSGHSSASTKRSSLVSDAAGSPHMTSAVPSKPRKANSGADSRHSAKREKAYIQTGSDRRIKVPAVHPTVDPLTQVREAYFAGHADRERLASEAERLNASASKYQPSRRPSRSDTFFEAEDRLHTLPRKYRYRRLSRSDTQSGPQPSRFEDNGRPQIRRFTTSEADRKPDRDQAPDSGGDVRTRVRISRDPRYVEQDLAHDFAERVRIGDECLYDRFDEYEDQDLDTIRGRQRQRESYARDEQEEILMRINENDRAQFSRAPGRNVYYDVPMERSAGRFEGGAGFRTRVRL